MITHKIHTSIAIFILIYIMSSCSKGWLEAKTDKSLAIPSTLNDFQGLLDNISIVTQNTPPLAEIASDGHYVADVTYQNRTKSINTDAYIWSKTVQSLSTGSAWAAPYTRILYCNIVLDGLQKLAPDNIMEREQYDNIKGQALLQRARTFFELAQIYAPPYEKNTSVSKPGIILRLSSDITIPSKRATVEQSYSQIIMDLIQAANLLPNRPTILTRGSKSAALGYLARVYLSMENYEDALKAAHESLGIYNTLLDFNTLSESASVIGRYNAEVVFHATFTDNFLTTNCIIERSLYDLYDANDLRKTRFFRFRGSNISFKGNYDNAASNHFSGITTAELLLIRAECYARIGDIEKAMQDLNTLYIKRWDSDVIYVSLTAINANDALRQVLLERQKELLLRGLRWSDLRRLNRDPQFATTLTRTIAGQTYILNPGSYKYTFPLPDDIIGITGALQNPGWD